MSGDSEHREEAVQSSGIEEVLQSSGREEVLQSSGRDAEVDPVRMEVFLEAMTPPGPLYLRSLEREALEAGVPVIRPRTQNLLRFFLQMKKPASILEIGTAVGFSALFMKNYAPAGCRIVTIEKDPVRAAQARKHFKEAEVFLKDSGGIELLEGDALDILPGISGDASFDFVFMDAAKGQYIHYLPEVLRLLRRDGLLVTDNILQEGEILSSRYIVTRRNRTIHSRMRTYLRSLMEDPALETLLLSAGDGAAVSVKRDESARGADRRAL